MEESVLDLLQIVLVAVLKPFVQIIQTSCGSAVLWPANLLNYTPQRGLAAIYRALPDAAG